jgi:GNAT superfamily N-acetyltransferase
MEGIRRCSADDRDRILAIVNAAAEAYRGVIPDDRWHEPYMDAIELDAEITAGVAFWGLESDSVLAGVMGVQPVAGVHLIRHAYVDPRSQRQGVGGRLLRHIRAATSGPMLVGTWADATWAIAFYVRHGFVQVSPQERTRLLHRYWSIPERQVETSVVLAHPPPAGR